MKYFFVNVLSFSCQPKANCTSFVEFVETLGSSKDREQFATSLRKMQHHHLMVGEFSNVSLSGPGPKIQKFDERTCRFCKTSFDDKEQLETHMKERELMNILYKVHDISCSVSLFSVIFSPKLFPHIILMLLNFTIQGYDGEVLKYFGTDLKSKVCGKCNVRIGSRSDLRKHIAHCCNIPKKRQCMWCTEKPFSTKSCYKAHLDNCTVSIFSENYFCHIFSNVLNEFVFLQMEHTGHPVSFFTNDHHDDRHPHNNQHNKIPKGDDTRYKPHFFFGNF